MSFSLAASTIAASFFNHVAADRSAVCFSLVEAIANRDAANFASAPIWRITAATSSVDVSVVVSVPDALKWLPCEVSVAFRSAKDT